MSGRKIIQATLHTICTISLILRPDVTYKKVYKISQEKQSLSKQQQENETMP